MFGNQNSQRNTVQFWNNSVLVAKPAHHLHEAEGVDSGQLYHSSLTKNGDEKSPG